MASVRCVFSFMIVLLTIVISWAMIIMIEYYSGHGKELKPHKLSEKPPFPGGKMNNIFWLIQISDIHISKFRDSSRQRDLKIFCQDYIDIYKPEAVLLTGDIVDAKDRLQIGSEQYVEEWEIYQNVLLDSNVLSKTRWLDVRGNHDAFDVPSLTSDQNMFRKYSASALYEERRNSKSYQVTIKTNFGIYSLNGIDQNLDPGPKRPFNFFGKINEEDLSGLEELVKTSQNHNLSIWFGHHPLSTVSGDFSYQRNLLKYGDVYLCGHLHTLGNIVPQLHAFHRDGHLELELADWKDNRRYRVLAVDHDLISFSDVTFGKWPVVVITNPKDAHYGILSHEPLNRLRKSTHIRLLAFSPNEITSVQIQIDGIFHQSTIQHVQGPLFVSQWKPELYSTGLHVITVIVKDAGGNVINTKHKFSIDGSRPVLNLLPSMILLTDGQTLGRVFYFVSFLFIVCGPLFLKCFNKYDLHGLGIWRGLTHLIRTKQIFYPLFFYGLYVAFGPWFIAELTKGHIGVVFLHGLYLKGRWIPEPTVYAYGFFQNVLFQLPLTVYLAFVLGQRSATHQNGVKTKSRIFTNIWGICHNVFMNILLFLTFSLQLYSSYSLGHAYGLMAFLVSPVKTWSLILMIYLVIRARTIG